VIRNIIQWPHLVNNKSQHRELPTPGVEPKTLTAYGLWFSINNTPIYWRINVCIPTSEYWLSSRITRRNKYYRTLLSRNEYSRQL